MLVVTVLFGILSQNWAVRSAIKNPFRFVLAIGNFKTLKILLDILLLPRYQQMQLLQLPLCYVVIVPS